MRVKKPVPKNITKRLTPMRAIRKYCVSDCMNGQPKEVELCTTNEDIPIGECPLYRLRLGKNIDKLKVAKQIRLKCIDCSGYVATDVRECRNTECVLFPFRMGINKRLTTARPNKGMYKRQECLQNFKTHGK